MQFGRTVAVGVLQRHDVLVVGAPECPVDSRGSVGNISDGLRVPNATAPNAAARGSPSGSAGRVGAVFVYVRDRHLGRDWWRLAGKMQGPAGDDGGFGRSLAMVGGRVAVGSRSEAYVVDLWPLPPL